ncbi:hypothetical protein EVAR_85346_1 [Eumeta japonica]|uniref:Uncharacterized protein n=1 Tax=Eumeta variegata TaxID=151549 RepID=A0A4C1WSU4_EUMVA|nr:hypothetical protein EVAR_85346_1 [Eumeta japonica]
MSKSICRSCWVFGTFDSRRILLAGDTKARMVTGDFYDFDGNINWPSKKVPVSIQGRDLSREHITMVSTRAAPRPSPHPALQPARLQPSGCAGAPQRPIVL